MIRETLLAQCAAILAACALPAAAAAQSITAEPDMVVFSGIAGGANPPAQTVAVATAAGATNWRLSSASFASWLRVTPASGSTPGSLNVEVNIAGMRAGVYHDTVGVGSADADTVRIPIVLALRDLPAPAGIATYQVELSFIGYTGLVEGAPDCRVNERGYDRLIGTLSGVETGEADESVVYTGTLRRGTSIDFCETKPGGGPDELVWCAVTLKGSAVTNVELTVYGEDGRGAWMKASPAGGPLRKSVAGDCAPPETNQILSDYPASDEGGGGTPNGQPIDDSRATDPANRRIQFYANGLARLRVGTYPPDGPQGGWTLRVIRKLP